MNPVEVMKVATLTADDDAIIMARQVDASVQVDILLPSLTPFVRTNIMALWVSPHGLADGRMWSEEYLRKSQRGTLCATYAEEIHAVVGALAEGVAS